MKLINLTTRPVVLSDGTILSAAGTEGATREVDDLSDGDQRRLVDRGSVHVVEVAAGSEEVSASRPRDASGAADPTKREKK